jgi:hypothetical protein
MKTEALAAEPLIPSSVVPTCRTARQVGQPQRGGAKVCQPPKIAAIKKKETSPTPTAASGLYAAQPGEVRWPLWTYISDELRTFHHTFGPREHGHPPTKVGPSKVDMKFLFTPSYPVHRQSDMQQGIRCQLSIAFRLEVRDLCIKLWSLTT